MKQFSKTNVEKDEFEVGVTITQNELNELMDKGSLNRIIEEKIADQLATIYIGQNMNEIYAKLDPQKVANIVLARASVMALQSLNTIADKL